MQNVSFIYNFSFIKGRREFDISLVGKKISFLTATFGISSKN